MPFGVLYVLSDIIRFLLKNVIGYRRSVIRKNLQFCFSQYTESDLRLLEKEVYQNFVDIILESLKGLGTNPHKLIPRYTFRNPEILNQHQDHIILFSQHLNNWEWAPICLGLQMKHELIGVVKFLSNKYINQFMIDGRSGNNVSVVPTYGAGKYFSQLPDIKEPKALVFIADQRPYGRNAALTLEFLGQSSLWHHGASLMAVKSSYPIYTIDVYRVARGRYEVEAYPLCEDPSAMKPEDLTKIYKDHLEDLVNKNKGSWLWSHKRFKESIKY